MEYSDGEIQVETNEDGRVVRVSGEFSRIAAAKLRTILLDGLKPGAKTVLDAAHVTEIDLCGLQLICSAHRTYVTRDAVFEVGEMSQSLQDTARSAGYESCDSICPYRRVDNCVWTW